jgi:amino acid adenylation domain-containing protein
VQHPVREHGFGPADRMLHKTRSSFDAHVWEILAPLVSGGTVVMAPPGVEEDPRAMLAAVAADKVTVLQVVPSVLRLLADLSAAEDWAAADSLRLLFCGGEPLQAALCRKVAGLRPGLRIVNTYGPTECAIDVTAHVVDAGQGPAGQSPAGQSPADGEPPAAGALVPIGTPITGTRALVLDDEGELLPPGVPGELCVTGPGVGLGYHRRPGQTAAAFVPDPYGPPGGRMYHTGDRVRRRPDGTLEFIGRRDHQVKVNGVRVELGEIESVLAAHPQVTAAVVTAAASADGTRLTGYVTGPADPGELRGYLRGRLPAPMVPAAFVVLREFPLSPSGKVDRAALPAAGGAAAGRREYAPPRTHAEQVITGIWAELLAVEPQRVGRDDDFFELGGHSLLTVRLAARLRGAFDVDLALRDLLTATTVAGQADLLGRQQTVQPVVPVPRDGPLPLSSGQRRLWFLDRLDPGGTQYVLPHVMRLHGAVDRAALRQALTEVVTRHEILRTRYVSADGEPGQVADPPGELPLSTATATGEELEGVLGELVGRPFDLAAGPVLRATLVTMADADEHLLVLCVHHIACDGWSMEIIGRELLACYAAARAGRPAGLHEPVLQYADYASWQQDGLTSPELSGDLAYWRGRLAGAVGAEVPPDRPRPPVWSGRGAMSSFTVPAELAGQLGRLGRGAGATPFMTMLAAFVVLLSRYTGSQDIVVGTPVAGRVDAQTRGLVGFFVNTLVLRTDLSGAPSFTELLRRVRTDCLAAYAHQDVPFERLVEDMQPDRDPSRNPVFQIMFEMGTDTVTAEAGGLSAEPVWDGLGWRTAKFDLTLGVAERTDGSLYGYIEYATDLFDAGTIDRLAANYLALLRSAVRAPGLAIGGLELLSGAERRMLLRDLSAEVGSGPPESAERLDEAIARQAAATPDAIAVEQGGITLSYARLEAAASAFAQALRGRGVAAETPVAVCARRGIGVVIALLAILKAGGVYLPLDPDNPPDRIASLLADSGAAIVLSEADLPDPRDRPGEPQAAPEPVTGPDNLAYVIYTSGSTGAPKGVMISHRAYLHHCRVIGDAYDIRPGDRVTLLSALVFDVAMDQMAATLLAGATIVVAESGLTSPARLAGWLGAQRVTHVEITPAHYRELMATVAPGDGRLGRLRLMNVGSDVVTYDDARRWYATGLPGTFLCNYGPTECTVTCTLHPVSAQEADDHRREQTVPIGRPVAGTRAYVLDRWLNPVPPGVPGELYLGGVRLARGYLRRPGLTAQRFIPDPFGPPGERLYRTGDLVRYREDGAIEFLGRLDTQVKIRGFRIELGEIEATLAGHPLVRAAAVTAHRAGGAPELSAYAVIEDGAEPRELRDYLRTRLPSYMVPAYWTILPELPLTPSGKVDRRALPAPERLRRAYAAPATPAQQQIAGVWARVLNLERVGIHDDFFEVGGHSLLATRVHTRIEELFAIELPLRRLFDATTVAALAAVVEAEVEARIAMLSDDEVEALLAQTAGPAGPAQTAQERTGDTARQNLTSEQRGESE